MDTTDDTLSNLVSSLTEQVRYMLTERLRNFSNEALNLIGQQKGLKMNRREVLTIILKSLKDVSGEMALELIRNSSLNDDDKILLNILYGNPRVAILSPIKTTKEEVSDDELILGGKSLVRQSLPEWPRYDISVGEED